MRTTVSLMAATLCLAMALPASAAGTRGAGCGVGQNCGAPSCCADCGCNQHCRKVTCQIICDYEEVEIKCWDCKCEDFCLPIPVLGSCLNGCGKSGCDPSCKNGSCGAGGCDVGCGSGCGSSCGAKGHCGNGQCHPAVTCGHPRTKKKLMLRTVTVKKPVYKCVTKYLCGGCAVEAETVAPEASVPAPVPAPAPKAAPLPPAPKQAVAPILPRF